MHMVSKSFKISDNNDGCVDKFQSLFGRTEQF